MPGNLTIEELETAVRGGEIDTVVVAFPDLFGRLMGKRLTARFFVEQVGRHGMHACAYLLTVNMDMEPLPGYAMASWETGYQDFKAVPDSTTLRRIPWLEKTALVLCDLVTDEGHPVEESPRRILQRQVERARAKGFTLKVASELEFYLFKESYAAARGKRYHDLVPYGAYIEDYHILQTTREEPIVRAIRNGMEAAGIPVETSKGEWGPGQQEINLQYADPVEMADRHVIYKNGVKEIADARGLAVTFMAKYDGRQAGSSFHLHASVWDAAGSTNLFWAPGDPPGSTAFRQFLAGQIGLARPFAYFYAPFINSYKRYQAGTFAPTRLAWGWDNRTCGFRVCGHGGSFRIENRIPGADANPYLAFAATIAAGLHGIERGLEPPPRFRGNAYLEAGLGRVPGTLREAIAELEQSQVAREAFGETVITHLLHTARLEQEAFDKAVTCWELQRTFEQV